MKDLVSIIMCRDNKSAILSDLHGQIKKISWKIDPDIDSVAENYGQVDGCWGETFLADDQENLFLGSGEPWANGKAGKKVIILNLKTRLITKIIKMDYFVLGVDVFDNGNKLVIVEHNGDLSIIESKSLEVIEKKVTNINRIRVMKLIC